MISRRAVIFAGLALPVAAFAHEGHTHLPLTVSADATVRRGKVEVTLTLFNAGHSPVTVSAAEVADASISGFVPVVVAGGEVAEHKITLEFSGDTPGIFTLLLDFGDRGSGPVVVVL